MSPDPQAHCDDTMTAFLDKEKAPSPVWEEGPFSLQFLMNQEILACLYPLDIQSVGVKVQRGAQLAVN